MNPILGNYTAIHNKPVPPAYATPGRAGNGTRNQIDDGGTVDWFRDVQAVGRDGKDLPQDVISSITPGRSWQSVRMRYNTLRGLTFERLVQYIDQWWYGYFRMAGMAWTAMMRRDGALLTNAGKRFKAVARHGYEIQMVADLEGDEQALAEEQQEFLQEFYDNLTCYSALNPDDRSGFSLLVRQMMESVAYYYAVHEIVWKPQDDGTLSADFIYCPVWWFEGVRGKLRYLDSEFQVWGSEMDPGQWLVSANNGLMECCSFIYMLKHGALRSWAAMLEKFGMPGLIGKTHAQKGTNEWNAMTEALEKFGQEFSAVIGGCTGDLAGNDISLVQASTASEGGAFAALVEKLDRTIAQLFRGGDLSTSSGQDQNGASLQGDESEIIEKDDAKFVEETLNERVTHYALEWRFGQDAPKYAYIKLRTTPQAATDSDIKVREFVLQNGGTLSLQRTYEAFNIPVPKEGEEVLQAPPTPAPGGQAGFADSIDINEVRYQCPDCRCELKDQSCPKCSRKYLLNGDATTIHNCGVQFTNRANLAPDARRLATAIAIDTAPLASSLSQIYMIQDPAEMRTRLTEFLSQIEREESALSQHSRAESVLHGINASALAVGLASANQKQKSAV